MDEQIASLPDGFEDIVIRNGKITARYNGGEYPKDLKLTCSSFKDLLKKMPYHGEKLDKDPDAEDMCMPPLILTFYRHLIKTGSVPSDLQLAEQHIDRYYMRLVGQGDKVMIKYEYLYNKKYTREPVSSRGMTNRILRMYPSLIRDLHFYLLCDESGYFDEVVYSVLDDFNGYDLTVIRADKKVHVRLMTNTKRSDHYNKKKYFRHDLDDSIIDIKINIGYKEKCGEFYLYNNSHLQLLLNHIDGKNG